ncbi:MAG: glycosyltransferase family 4 protein [Bacteroidota bacterium]
MHKLKVCYIISDINKALAFEWIASNLDYDRFDVQFILLNPGSSMLEEYLQSHQYKVIRIICTGKKDWPLAWLSLCRLLLKQKPDIVHCHLLTASILGLSAAKFAGIRQRIYTRHHSDYHFRYFPKGVKWDKWCNRLATKIIAPSHAVKTVLTEMEFVPKEKVELIFHGFDLDYFRNVSLDTVRQVKLKYNPGDKHPVVGVISRFTELKGIQYIIPAFRQLLEQYPDALLLLFNANGDYKQQIDAQLAELPSESYNAVPFENELAAVYALFDVFVQASTDTLIESFGQTYIEALACGVPSVFTLAGVAPDFIKDHENAIVVPFKDADAINKGILEILDKDELRNKIIEVGRNSVRERFSLHEMIKELTELYCNIMKA